MAYQKQTWVDGASGGTPINATRLNHMEDCIDNASYDDVYSTTETKTNKVWIDGKHLYRKTIFMDSLTFNAKTINVPHNIENIGKVKSIDYSMFYSPDASWYTNWDNIINEKN